MKQVIQKINESGDIYRRNNPFPHVIIDNFLDSQLADSLFREFPDPSNGKMFAYNNPLEIKLALNDWNAFPPATYSFLQFMNSDPVVQAFSDFTGINLYADNGLHGGGWHMHGPGGKLNPHLDYSLHPKLGLQRKLNLILYLTPGWSEDWGGHLGLWEHVQETKQPGQLKAEVAPIFNRALIFDTTKNSWHGISRLVSCPTGNFRRSIAIYYLCDPPENVDRRARALYAPTEEQKENPEILDLIQKRADLSASTGVYISKK